MKSHVVACFHVCDYKFENVKTICSHVYYDLDCVACVSLNMVKYSFLVKMYVQYFFIFQIINFYDLFCFLLLTHSLLSSPLCFWPTYFLEGYICIYNVYRIYMDTWLVGHSVDRKFQCCGKLARPGSAQLPLHYVSYHLFIPPYFIDTHTRTRRVMLGEIVCV